jgi:hypothetical protein
MDKSQFIYLMGVLWLILSLIFVNGVYARGTEDEGDLFISKTFYNAILIIAWGHIAYAGYLAFIA